MLIIVVLLNGNRVHIEIENSDKVSDLKMKINQDGYSSVLFVLSFKGQELEDHLLLSDYNIRHESVVEMRGKQRGGSIPYETVMKHSDKTTLMKSTNWIYDSNEKGEDFISFMPITDKLLIPFYDEVTQQPYHDGLNEKDKEWINQYTGESYEKLKVHSYTLEPDEAQLEFLKGLYLACWAAVQSDLPTKVYHICNLTEKSFSWFEEKQQFYTPGFVSTSKNPNLDWPGNCKWEITLTKGRRHHAVDVKTISKYPKEDEILISCCTRFRVLSKHIDHKGYKYYLYLKYLDL